MDKTIKEQLEAIRRSGETNMLDVEKVQYIANREGYYELVVFIEEHRSEYVDFIFHGDSGDNVTTEETGNTEDTENATKSTEDAVEGAIHGVAEYHYNLTGQKRKELVEAISRILSLPAIYQKAPTFSYQIGDCTVDRNGKLAFSSSVSLIEAQKLVTNLKEQGYIAEDAPNAQNEAEFVVAEEDEEETVPKTPPAPTLVQDDEVVGTAEVSMGTETLEVEELDDKLCFPWFTLHGLEGEADAYTRLITAMVEMSKKQKRVVAVEKPVENAKFTMRLFLIRLGFIGDEYKTARKILLRNLTGNSSWRYGKPQEKSVTEETSAFPLNPQDANSHIPEEALLDAATIPTNTETTDTLCIPENTEINETPENIHVDYPDAFPEDKGDVPYDK